MSPAVIRLVLVVVILFATPMTSRLAWANAGVPAQEPEVATSETTAGKIQTVDAEARVITIKHKKEDMTFAVADDCAFVGFEKEGMTLADLTIGERARISWAKEGDKQVAHKIEHLIPKEKTRRE